MQWSDLRGHDLQRTWFSTAVQNRRLATSFLFVGAEGIGKRTFARLLAKSLLCRSTDAAELQHCGNCEDCVQVDASTHPDLLQISKPPEKANLPVELLIGERDKRMREGLCHDISLRPYGGKRKIAILDDADSLNIEGANCLLKTLEEPPPDSLLILIGTSLQRQLSTIRSRCQAILFHPLDREHMVHLMMQHQIADSAEQAAELADRCGGSLAEARLATDPELREFRNNLLHLLSSTPLAFPDLAKQCGSIVDSAGKEARLKRDRMRTLFGFAAGFYRVLTLRLCHDSQFGTDRVLEDASAAASRHWSQGIPGAVACWQRCLAATEQVDRNANQTGLLESWAADLARLSGR